MGLVARNPVFGVSNKAILKPVSSAIETSWKIEIFACSKIISGTFQKANNKSADQTARMRRLVCAFVVRKPPKTGFLATRPIYRLMLACFAEPEYIFFFKERRPCRSRSAGLW